MSVNYIQKSDDTAVEVPKSLNNSSSEHGTSADKKEEGSLINQQSGTSVDKKKEECTSKVEDRAYHSSEAISRMVDVSKGTTDAESNEESFYGMIILLSEIVGIKINTTSNG